MDAEWSTPSSCKLLCITALWGMYLLQQKGDKVPPKRLMVRYYREEIDEALDSRVEEAMLSVGYRLYATGYHFVEGYRELCFEEKESA